MEYTTQITSAMTSAVTTLNTRFRARARGPGASKRTEPAIYRATASRLPSQPKNSPIGSVKMTNPTMKMAPM